MRNCNFFIYFLFKMPIFRSFHSGWEEYWPLQTDDPVRDLWVHHGPLSLLSRKQVSMAQFHKVQNSVFYVTDRIVPMCWFCLTMNGCLAPKVQNKNCFDIFLGMKYFLVLSIFPAVWSRWSRWQFRTRRASHSLSQRFTNLSWSYFRSTDKTSSAGRIQSGIF